MKTPEQMKQERQEQERQEQERQNREWLEREWQEQKRQERERQNRERQEREQQNRERQERERQEREWLEREWQEQKRQERERQEQKRQEQERQERERQERERQEREQPEQKRQERDLLERELEILLKDIRKFIGDGKYIFRGENKKRDKISSNLYRYFKTIAGRAELQKKNIVIDLSFIKQPLESQLEIQLEKQFGKGARKIDFATIEKSLKENILNQLAQKENDPPEIDGMQKSLILQDVQEYVDFKDEVDILTELQHYGGSTNLIDFSYDLAIALFFACDGESDEDGRLIVLDEKADGVKPPPKKYQNNRAALQKSIFVRRDVGYIDEQEEGQKIKQFEIPKNLKPLLLTYVQNYFGIRTETVYGDLIGYIQNQKRHSEAYKQFFAGRIHYQKGEFKEAIKCYTKAIKVKPNFADAYFKRGVIYEEEGEHEFAINDYTLAIELNPKHDEARYSLLVLKLLLAKLEGDERIAAKLEKEISEFLATHLMGREKSEK